ncbi:MAG TPA: universal stress protein [Mycobacterium sp.]|nr:universal stress protein [Mycobacterium sp.]
MALVVGFDRHPASRAALRFAGELAGALNVPLHVVHVADLSDSSLGEPTPDAPELTGRRSDPQQHVAATLDPAQVQWTYHRMDGDPVAALLQAAAEHAAEMIVVGRPEQGIGAVFGHIVTGAVARTLIRRSRRPVVVVPEDVDGLR